jgi:CHAD domain-containing protein
MAYQFRIDEPFGRGLRRIARQQLRRIDHLIADNPGANAIHDARKGLKRLRALLVLAQPILGKSAWKKEDHRYRNIARGLSAARDRDVLLNLTNRLAKDSRNIEHVRMFTELRECLDHMNGRMARGPAFDAGDLGGKIKAARRALKRLDLGGKRGNFPFEGFERDYGCGRRVLEQVLRKPDIDCLHELRKHVQRHWRHMQLFEASWPSEATARIELAKLASDILGEDHDLSMLRLALRGPITETLHLATRQRIDGICREAQAHLQSRGLAAARMLFAERKKALTRRLEVYRRYGYGLQPVMEPASGGRSGLAPSIVSLDGGEPIPQGPVH